MTTTAPTEPIITSVEDDALWYKDAVIYELHVRSFNDSNGDGVGDFRGLTEKLDYLQGLGVTAIWLLPFFPSPLKDDGYDISDYVNVHPMYGTLSDFTTFLEEAHRRGIRVIIELVVNHTSDQHPAFQRARQPRPNNHWRDLYVWSNTPERYPDCRVIFKDFETSNWTWDSVAKAYYWHRFYAHQPDLNFDNPYVKRAIFRAVDFWLGLGVDGLRLDAIPYLYEREGTDCENLPETHAFLKELRSHIDSKFKNRMLLSEANQWPEDVVAYFGEGDESHMAFHFPLMPRLFMAIRMEDNFPLIDILRQTPAIPEQAQWAIFLRNHDELTLEMVTDEERDYMYRSYAYDSQARINLGIRRRLAPLLGNDRRKIELINGLLLSLPGTPVLYYGDELGMGDNFYLGDRNALRTPMHWSGDRNAGFSRTNPQRLFLPVIIDAEYHYEALNVEVQQNNPSSLLWWMKRVIALRKRYQAFGRGTTEFVKMDNPKVLAFVRRFEDETILVVANLSRFTQHSSLDLSKFKGTTPTELFGRTSFPDIGDEPYFLTLGPHTFYWFSLVAEQRESPIGLVTQQTVVRLLTVSGTWDAILRPQDKGALESILPNYLRASRWFGGKGRRMLNVEIIDAIPIPQTNPLGYLTVLQVDYSDGEPERYVLPLAYANGEQAAKILEDRVGVARLRVRGRSEDEEGVLYDALLDREFSVTLLEALVKRQSFSAELSEVTATSTRALQTVVDSEEAPLEPSISRAEQSNTSVVYGDKYILKLFRRLEEGENPDLEIGRYLTEQRKLGQIASVYGALEYRHRDTTPLERIWQRLRGQATSTSSLGEASTLGVLQEFVENQGDAWQYTQGTLSRYSEEVMAQEPALPDAESLKTPLLDLLEQEAPPQAVELIGLGLEFSRLVGQRTAEMHKTLANEQENPNFTPEPFTEFYQRSIYQAMRSQNNQVFDLLRSLLRRLPEDVLPQAQEVLLREEEINNHFRALIARRIVTNRIRVHGNYHLGQVLYTGKDVVIIDFEGQPARPISERRLKRSPLRDVAGMLRSFSYAAYTSELEQTSTGPVEGLTPLHTWASFWRQWVSHAFLKSYLETAGDASFIPKDETDTRILLNAYLLEKAVYEVGYELNSRPDRVNVPLLGILELLGSPA